MHLNGVLTLLDVLSPQGDSGSIGVMVHQMV